MTLIEQINRYPKFFNAKGCFNHRLLNSKFFLSSDIHKSIKANTDFLANPTFAERVYCIVNRISVHNMCSYCNSSKTSFISFTKGYALFCSTKCSANSKQVLEKTKKTCLEKYGVINPAQHKKVKEKTKKTCLEKYGVDSFSKTDEFKEKTKKTCLEKYGVDSKQKLESNKEKTKKTCLEKYGVESKQQLNSNKEKTKKTCLEKYGVEYYVQTRKFKEKTKKTCLEKYGVEYVTQRHIPENIISKLNSKEWLTEQHHILKKTQMQIATELFLDNTTVMNYLKMHNIEIHYYNHSMPQIMLSNKIKNAYNTTVVTNTRNVINPYELDIYLPEHHLAIEYNGIYWHRPELYGSKELWLDYHQNKIDLCSDKGIRLLHVWEGYKNHMNLVQNAISGHIDNDLIQTHKYLYE